MTELIITTVPQPGGNTEYKFAEVDANLLALDGNFTTFTQSYYVDSASFDYRINNLSTSGINTSSCATTGSNYFSGSQVVTGSVTSTVGFTGSLQGTSSWSINSVSASYALSSSLSVTSSNTILQNSITTNQTVGGLSSGTALSVGSSIESILRTMLITYIPPTLSSLTLKLNGGSSLILSARDVGNSFTFNTASFTATADNPTSIYPISASFTASNADAGTITYYFGNNVLSSTNNLRIGTTATINKASGAATVTFTVNGKRSDTGASITGATTTVSFQWRNYLAASSTIPADNLTAQTVVNAAVTSTLGSSKSWTATCTSANDTTGNYTYIVYPASYGDLSNVIQNGALSVLTAFTNLGDFIIANAYSSTISVRIYKSNSDKAFANGTTLAIT